ncbi:hypothetical protein DVH24_000091 [Malus domestica]|uniref:Uncharacterized protein n=1 Tax=Malus domestica TaxID=3750 RepID=A0A498J3K4_MALDO|nr:hypothetical protein DVH24_000091 [Malus domestica]
MLHTSKQHVTSQYDIVRYGLTIPSRFCFWESHKNLLVGHPSWECSCPNSFNFRVPMESKASEFPKGLVL